MSVITNDTRWKCADTGFGRIQFQPTVKNYQKHASVDIRMAMVKKNNQCWLHGGDCVMEQYEEGEQE